MLTIVCCNTAVALDAGHPVEGRPAREDDIEAFTWIFADRGRSFSALDYVRAVDLLRADSLTHPISSKV